MIRPRPLVAILITCLVAACGSADPSPPPAEPTASAPASQIPEAPAASPSTRPSPPPIEPADAWEEITQSIGRDGTVSLETALAAFALLNGPLPGVEPATGPAPDIASGSAPIRWIIGHWDGLTGAQREAVEDALEPAAGTADAGGATTGPLVASLGAVPLVASTCQPGRQSSHQAEFDSQAASASAQIADRLGRSLRLPIVIRFAPPKGGLAAEASPRDGSCAPTAKRPALCLIEVFPRGEGLLGFEMVDVVAHEVFHCFQYDLAKTAAEAGRVGPWLAEGSAAWVGEVISGGSTVGEEWWESWVKYPWTSLFERKYDGVGFFAHLQESGVDPWPLLDKMLNAGAVDSVAAYEVAAKAAGDKVLDLWGPGYVRHQTLRPDWSMGGPGFPEFVPTPIARGPLANGETAVAGASPLGADAYRIDLSADVMVLQELFASEGTVHGLVHLPDGRQLTLEEAVGKPFCTKPGGCTCPTGSAGAGHAWEQTTTGEVLLGVAGHTDGVELWVHGYSTDTTCAQAPEDFVPEEPCWCPPGPLGRVDGDDRPTTAASLAAGGSTAAASMARAEVGPRAGSLAGRGGDGPRTAADEPRGSLEPSRTARPASPGQWPSAST